jgi:phosphatidylglycerol:prolipoprotein diacylglycerol transferase
MEDMLPTLFRIGGFSVSTYGVLVALAVFTAGWIAARGFRERGLSGDEAWNLLIVGVVGGFVGAKLYYVLLRGDPGALLSRGGFVWYGGLIGGAVAIWFALRHKGLPLGPAADAFAPALALGHGIGHIGCFFSGDSYGLPSTLPWAVKFRHGMPPSTAGALRSEFGVSLPSDIPDSALIAVHPTMLYSALTLIAIFGVLWLLRNRQKPAGWLFGLYLILTGVERFLVEFVRAKDDRFIWGFTTAQVIAVAAILGGAVLLVTIQSRARRVTQPATARAR